MKRSSTLVCLVAGTLLAAACGGGSADEAGPDADATVDTTTASPDTAHTPTETEAPADTPTSDVGDPGGDDGATPAALGPELTPSATFAIPAPTTPPLHNLAVSPTGDRVAVVWVDESDFSTNLAVYDTASGAELVAIVDDRLEHDLFWTSDDRIITADNFATVRAWDSTTLEAISEDPLTDDSLGCAGGNGTVFDPVAGALFLKSESLCRIDVTTGDIVQFESDTRTSLLAVAIGGNEVYLRGTDAAGDLVLRVLDSTTLDVISDEPAESPNPVIGASGNGVIAQRSGGFDYEVQPSGRLVDFYTSGITTSAAGGYYVSGFDAGTVVISATDGTTVGTIANPGGPVIKTAWSADDSVLVARTDDGLSVFDIS